VVPLGTVAHMRALGTACIPGEVAGSGLVFEEACGCCSAGGHTKGFAPGEEPKPSCIGIRVTPPYSVRQNR
jgi:hypothetical protein